MLEIRMLKAKKSLGQNFLINRGILDKIISTADLSKDDTVLEIGPGTGNLTIKLSEKAGRVIAVEKDRQLIEPLREILKNYPNLEIVEGDILKLEVKKLVGDGSYKVVANIPYYITSILLRQIFENWPLPKIVVLTVQKEVAQRIIARPPHMNLLALSVQFYSEPKIIGYVSRNSFRPAPKVDSAIIRLNPKSETLNSGQTEKLFKLMKVGFSEKRKQLAALLSKKLKIEKEKISDALRKEGIKENTRAENLSLEQWEKLNAYLSD